MLKKLDSLIGKNSTIQASYSILKEAGIKCNMKIKDKYKTKIISALTISNKKDVSKYKYYSEISEIIL